MLNPTQQARILKYLKRMIDHTMELGCTCERLDTGTGPTGHRPHCSGVDLTKDARAYLTRLKGKGTI